MEGQGQNKGGGETTIWRDLRWEKRGWERDVPSLGGEFGGGGKERRYIDTKNNSLQAQNKKRTMLFP